MDAIDLVCGTEHEALMEFIQMNILSLIQRKAKKLNQQQAFAAALIKQQLASKQEMVA